MSTWPSSPPREPESGDSWEGYCHVTLDEVEGFSINRYVAEYFVLDDALQPYLVVRHRYGKEGCAQFRVQGFLKEAAEVLERSLAAEVKDAQGFLYMVKPVEAGAEGRERADLVIMTNFTEDEILEMIEWSKALFPTVAHQGSRVLPSATSDAPTTPRSSREERLDPAGPVNDLASIVTSDDTGLAPMLERGPRALSIVISDAPRTPGYDYSIWLAGHAVSHSYVYNPADNGNCGFSAISVALVGNETLSHSLRLAVHRYQCQEGPPSVRSDWESDWKSLGRFMLFSDPRYDDCKSSKEAWDIRQQHLLNHAGVEGCTQGEYISGAELYALSILLGRPIWIMTFEADGKYQLLKYPEGSSDYHLDQVGAEDVLLFFVAPRGADDLNEGKFGRQDHYLARGALPGCCSRHLAEVKARCDTLFSRRGSAGGLTYYAWPGGSLPWAEEDADEEEPVTTFIKLGHVGVPQWTNWRFLQNVTANGWTKVGGQVVPRFLYRRLEVCEPPLGAALPGLYYGRFIGEAHPQPTCVRCEDNPRDESILPPNDSESGEPNFDLDFDLDQSFVGGRPAKRARHHDR